MKIMRAYKTELDLNDKQKTVCARHAGAARWAYNWGLSRSIAAYEAGEKHPTAISLHKELNVLKKTEIPWMYAVSKTTPQEALRNLDRAFANFFRRMKLKKEGKSQGKVGFPKFKSKKKGLGSYQVWGSIHVFPGEIQLPRMGRLKLKESHYIPVDGIRILSATVSEKAGRWFVSVQCEAEIPNPVSEEKAICGVDLGIKTLAMVSDGTVFENPKALSSSMDKIKRLQRIVSRRKIGSNNRKKASRKLAKAHRKAANIRKNTLHQITSYLAKTKSVVMIEDLNVSGMLKNHKLAQAISDVGFYEFKRQMLYKGDWYGCQVMLAGRFYPSSKTCSCCGHVKAELGLGERSFKCEACGCEMDRDLNAAINLEHLIRTTGSSSGSNDCPERGTRNGYGEDVRPPCEMAVLGETVTRPQSILV